MHQTRSQEAVEALRCRKTDDGQGGFLFGRHAIFVGLVRAGPDAPFVSGLPFAFHLEAPQSA